VGEGYKKYTPPPQKPYPTTQVIDSKFFWNMVGEAEVIITTVLNQMDKLSILEKDIKELDLKYHRKYGRKIVKAVYQIQEDLRESPTKIDVKTYFKYKIGEANKHIGQPTHRLPESLIKPINVREMDESVSTEDLINLHKPIVSKTLDILFGRS